MSDFLVHIEIPKKSAVKYEFDHKTNRLMCDRILHGPMEYFFNYGYFPNTLSGDGDPLDALVLCEESLYPCCYINVRIIGALITEDESGMDEKIISVPVTEIDPTYKDIHDINQLPKNILQKIRFFYENYKKLEPNKWIKVLEYVNCDIALNIYNESKKTYNKKENKIII
jgi:inorganic pyrophosphatase